MELLDSITSLLGDDLKRTLAPGAKLKVAASCFSIYAYEALKAELEQVESVEFIFTSPTFVPNDVADKLRKEHREFHIPRLERERSLYGSEFEVRLRNELTQKAIARECADWMRRKATFRSNRGRAPMQQFACVSGTENAAYMPLHGFTAVDLGYEKGNAVSNFVNKFDEQPMTGTWLALFEQIWNDKEKLEDVTERLCESITSRPREANAEYFKGKVLKTDQGEIDITAKIAKQIEFYLIENRYVDFEHHITETYHQAKDKGERAPLPKELEPYKELVFALIDSVFSEADIPAPDNEFTFQENKLNANFERREFQDLWHRINHKAVYSVQFDSEELIAKSIQAINKELNISPLQYLVTGGEQKDETSYEEFKDDKGFVVMEKFVDDLDASTEVVVYAKLPKTFFIPTPVGNYNPDWAIAFKQGEVKHVYFIAETKGDLSSLQLCDIEKSKIACARKFFAKITNDQVRYEAVDGYGKLMDLVK